MDVLLACPLIPDSFIRSRVRALKRREAGKLRKNPCNPRNPWFLKKRTSKKKARKN
jgi:hypothetical protein